MVRKCGFDWLDLLLLIGIFSLGYMAGFLAYDWAVMHDTIKVRDSRTNTEPGIYIVTPASEQMVANITCKDNITQPVNFLIGPGRSFVVQETIVQTVYDREMTPDSVKLYYGNQSLTRFTNLGGMCEAKYFLQARVKEHDNSEERTFECKGTRTVGFLENESGLEKMNQIRQVLGRDLEECFKRW